MYESLKKKSSKGSQKKEKKKRQVRILIGEMETMQAKKGNQPVQG